MTAPLANRRAAHGFTLLSVLVAMLVLGIGLLTLARTTVNITGEATQNENVNTIATLSNAFWGVVQTDPSLLTTSNFVNTTYSASNLTSAPAALQPWLTQLTSTTAPFGLPNGTAYITTSADAGTGNACSTSGCTVTLLMTWQQVAANGQAAQTRSQVFYYQFGL